MWRCGGEDMTLEQELLNALEQATARTAIATGELGLGHLRKTVVKCLLGLHQRRVLGTCRISKGGETFDVWWKIGAGCDPGGYTSLRKRKKH